MGRQHRVWDNTEKECTMKDFKLAFGFTLVLSLTLLSHQLLLTIIP